MLHVMLLLFSSLVTCHSFQNGKKQITNINSIEKSNIVKSSVYMSGLGSIFPFLNNDKFARAANAMSMNNGNTGEIIKDINGIKQKRLGSGDIIVSELGLGTQRWMGDDFNSPNEELCFKFLDEAVLNQGINLIDTAEQYPIPSSASKPEGLTETTIGKWIVKDKVNRRSKLVISTKITGGRNVNRNNIIKDCDGSLKRLGTDYIDVYLLHWPARYTPQSNWGQSLQYHYDAEQYYKGNAGFAEIAETMGQLVKEGKIRGIASLSCYIEDGRVSAAHVHGLPTVRRQCPHSYDVFMCLCIYCTRYTHCGCI